MSGYNDQVYGKHLQWVHDQDARQADFTNTSTYFDGFERHGLFYVKEEQVQVERKRVDIDKENLPFERKMAIYLKEYCFSTSAHGIPMIGQSTTTPQRVMWTLLFLSSFSMYWFQITQVMEKYNLMEKIVEIELIFEPPPFPAITLCNLNPYKRSSAEGVPLVARMLNAFDDVLTSASKKQEPHRRRRSGDHGQVMFEPAKSVCECVSESQCEANKIKPPGAGDKLCICAFDRHSGDAWPCYPEERWNELEICLSCNAENVCHKDGASQLGNIEMDCMCQTVDSFCVAHDEQHEMLNLWEYYGNVAPTEDPSFMEALGFSGMTDEVAIVTKAKENMVFAMASLPMDKRREISMPKEDFVQKCSFNSKQCDIDDDFETRIDPIFGNCFTFNFNRTKRLTSSRAGPMFGWSGRVVRSRIEYLPTTEAAGVKLTIHEKDQFPFPDLTGYNAPVGYTSSFGIRMKRMERLPAPYGDCTSKKPEEMSTPFVYDGFSYSTEGCMRSCFQAFVLHQCDCGDPRFPVQRERGQSHCDVGDPTARRCLDKWSQQQAPDADDPTAKKMSVKCSCPQPCVNTMFTVSYSAAQWPSPSLQVQLGLCEGSQEYCIQYYRDNGAMLEVFFEQLNYELLSEFPAYGFTNLLADFGGQFGLWLGVSVITICEFLFLVLNVSFMVLKHQYKLYLKKKAEREGQAAEDQKKEAV